MWRYGSPVTLVAMTTPDPSAPHARSGAHSGQRTTRARRAWRVGTPVAVLLSGALFAVSAANSDGTDLRPGRYTDLATLVQGEADTYQSLQDRIDDLNAEVESLTTSVRDARVERRQREADALMEPAGLTPTQGAGVTVVLGDAPASVIEAARASSPDADIRRLIVHQQDIQAVVNAMWSAGAGAVTIQGQRIVSTTGIKCSGSAVQLQGIPYPQPYTIQAVGDPAAIEAALSSDVDVTAFRADALEPDIDVGFSFQTESTVEAPAFDGLVDISQAVPLPGGGTKVDP